MSLAEKALQLKQDFDEVYDAGKQAEYDAFWDVIQENGTKTDYYFAFAGRAWQNNFRPKYSIRPTNAACMFGYWNKGSLDLVSLSEELGIEFDFSQATNVASMFASNEAVTRVGTIDTCKASNVNSIFNYCFNLHTIEKLILKDDGTTAFNADTFRSCTRLVNITIEGAIGKTGLNMQWSTTLSKASITSIINALSTTTSGLSITLSKTAVNSAFATTTGGADGSTSAEWTALVATRSNWTISLV